VIAGARCARENEDTPVSMKLHRTTAVGGDPGDGR
jgi:hypothetical protein